MYQKSLIGEKQDKGGRMSEPSDNLPPIPTSYFITKTYFFEFKYKYNAYNIEEMHIIDFVHIEEMHLKLRFPALENMNP